MAILALALAPFICSPGGTGQSLAAQAITGRVLHGEAPLGYSQVTLYRAGAARGAGAQRLAFSRADVFGDFSLTYTQPSDAQAVLYVIAAGPRQEVKLASALGKAPLPSSIVINERTTVAAAYALAQFWDGGNVAGVYPGPQNAAATAHNLADVANGHLAEAVSTYPNGLWNSSMRTFNSLSNVIASCVRDSDNCPDLFALGASPLGATPSNTLDAAVNIARTTWRASSVSGLFDLSTRAPIFKPALDAAPDHWALAISYDGNGEELDGPGNMSFDGDGNVWVGNNYTFSLNPADDTVCGGTQLIKLTPWGDDYGDAPYEGASAGLYGAGFGITLDKAGNVWVGNFAFQGSGCANVQSDYWDTVSRFDPQGQPLGANPIFSDDSARPQGMVTDTEGNVWVANCQANSVTKFVGGAPDGPVIYGDLGLEKPFDVAIDPSGNAWITSNDNHTVFIIDPQGNHRRVGDPDFFQRPMGIAGDSKGNMWVSNSGALDPPCGEHTLDSIIAFLSGITHDEQVPGASVTMMDNSGQVAAGAPFTKGGAYMPWGIAVDGNDNVLVANFNGQRLTFLCGADTSKCPPGKSTGDPMSPKDGYTFDGLVRNTGVQVDPSGNVWLANNWETVPLPTNPGGHQMVVFIGLAAPVKTPMIGPPRQP